MNLATLLSACAVAAVAAEYSFVSIGDWGGVNLGGYHADAERAVAKTFEATAKALDAKFVVNVGDNFYYCGVKSVDDPLFQTDFESVFTETSIPWYSTLGNHDYGYSPQAQIDYKSPKNDRWVLPARYYSKRVQLSDNEYLTMIFLDSNPCVKAYRADDPSGWDPCSGKYGDCPGCKFHDNILEQNCTAQLQWLRTTLQAVDANDWLIVVGHHPAHEMDVEDFVSLLTSSKVDLYLNGHTHELNQYVVDGSGHYITTGAGCMVAINDKSDRITTTAKHEAHYEWWSRTAGFTTHTFSSTFKSLTTKFVAYNGTTIRSVEIRKH